MATLLATYYTYWAISGTNTPAAFDNRYFWKIYLNSQSASTAKSSIEIKGYVEGNGTPYTTFNSNVRIDGTYKTTEYLSTTLGYSTAYIDNWTFDIQHNTSTGVGSFTFVGRGGVGTSYTYTSTKTINLPTINLYPTLTGFAATVLSPDGISTAWTATPTCDDVDYSTDGGTTWADSGTSGTSGSFTISGLDPSTTYNLKIRLRRADSGLTLDSHTLSRTTHKLSTLTSSASFNIGVDIPIVIDRQDSTYTHTVELYASATYGVWGTAIRTETSVGASDTLTLTTTEKNAIYAKIPNSNTAYTRIEVSSFKDSVDYGTTYKEGTATVINSDPVFTTFTYEDTDTETLALTSTDQSIIKDYSDIKATVSTANAATAQNYATMISYQLVVGAKQVTESYSAVADVELDIEDIATDEFTVYAIDSRGNSTAVELTASTYFDYVGITLGSASGTRTNGTSDETTLEGAGTFFDEDFGTTANSVSAVYEYKKTTDASYTSGITTITPVEGTSTYTIDQTIRGDLATDNLGFDPSYAYNIKVTASDELSSSEYIFTLGTGQPNLALHQDGIAIGQPYNTSDGGTLQIAGSYNGWVNVRDTWAYSSVDDPTGIITVPSDATDTYSVGMRISFVNGGNTIYGIITAVTSTTITFLHEIDPTDNQALYLMANSAITLPKYSTQKAPLGFPQDPDSWAIILKDNTRYDQTPPTAGTWYNLGSYSLSIPIGAWNVSYKVITFFTEGSGSATITMTTTLSTSTSSESDREFTTVHGGRVVTIENFYASLFTEKNLKLTTKDTYYLIHKTGSTTYDQFSVRSDIGTTIIKAQCVYL